MVEAQFADKIGPVDLPALQFDAPQVPFLMAVDDLLFSPVPGAGHQPQWMAPSYHTEDNHAAQ